MKKRLYLLAVLAMLGIASVSAFDLKDLLTGAGAGQSSTAGDIVGGLINAVTSSSVEYNDLVGNWAYNSPAVTFESDNVVQKATGAVGSAAIVSKIKPYYDKAGLNGLTIEFGADSTFVAKVKRMTVQGTVESLGNGAFKFDIKALGKIPAGSINARAERQGSNLALTFDAQKLIKLVETVASLSGNATLKTASDLIKSYDGVNIGFNLKKK